MQLMMLAKTLNFHISTIDIGLARTKATMGSNSFWKCIHILTFKIVFTINFSKASVELVCNTGCSNSICAKKTHFLAIKNALLSHKNSICTFMRCGHLTYDPWIWLKDTSMASTASNRKSTKTPYNSGLLIIHVTLRDQYW